MLKSVPRIVCGLLTLTLVPLWSNWGSYSGGNVATGTFRAFGTAQIEMRDENLSIQLYRDRAKVQVEYELTNTAEAVDVRAGFPCLGLKSEKPRHLEIEDYQMSADGQPVPYRIETGDVTKWKNLFNRGFLDMARGPNDAPQGGSCPECGLWWLASTVHFEKGQTRHIAIRYESLYEFSQGGYSDDTDFNANYFRYLLSTASAWKGPIRNGKVTLRAVTMDPRSITIKPRDRFRETTEGFIWDFSNLKPAPQDDIEVCLNNRFSTKLDYSIERPSDADHQGDANWYSFEGSRYYFDFHGYTAKSSSAKPGYPAQAVGDFEKSTVWAAGRNSGIGESITLTLKKPGHVDQLGIIPGYAKSKQLYFANNRVRQLDVTINGGYTITTELPDEYISFAPFSKRAYELIDLGSYRGEARTITLTVKQIYPGSKYQDTLISEILLRRRLSGKPTIRGPG